MITDFDDLTRALLAERKQRLARTELQNALDWIEHWQRDVAANLKPTETSLTRVSDNIRRALKESA